MFAIAILTLGLIAFAPLALASKKMSSQAVMRDAAVGFAKKQMEELKQTSFNLLPSGSTVQVSIPSDVKASLPVIQSGAIVMQAAYTVTTLAQPTIKQLSVRVWWSSTAGTQGADIAPISEVRLSQVVCLEPGDSSYTGP